MGNLNLQELWRFRNYIRGSVKRDFALRYQGSVLGATLVFLVPAFQIALYVLVFGNLLKGRLPDNPTIYGYSIYLCSGLLLWNFFGELLGRTQNVYLENANLLKKSAFPRAALSVINFLSSSINYFLATFLLLVFLFLSSSFPGPTLVGLIPVWIGTAILALSVGLCLALLQVFFRDFATLMPIVMQALFWSTPIVYPLQILPEWLQPWMSLNPLLAPVGTVQGLMLGASLPGWEAWISTACLVLLSGCMAYRLHLTHRIDLMDNL